MGYRLAQLSDLHLVAPGGLCMGRVDTAAMFAAAVQRLLPCRPQALLLSGDLSDDGSPASYALLRELLAPVLVDPSLELTLIPGNHDAREPLRQAFAERLPVQGPLHSVRNLGPMRLLALDTLVEGQAHGSLDATALNWLESQLAVAPSTPTLLALHHPPVPVGIDFMDRIALREGAAALESLVALHGQLRRVLCGHVHRHVETLFGGVPLSVAPSTAHQLPLPLPEGRQEVFRMEPPGFLLHDWQDGRLLTHQVVIGDFGPEYPYA